VKETFRTARTPPKALLRPWTARTVIAKRA
jgi:hypothetical protein